MTTTWKVREERAADAGAIRAVNDAAFGGPAEGLLVDELRSTGRHEVSLVALDEGDSIVGHILFSVVPLEAPDGQETAAAALAPMAVAPSKQRLGVGSALVLRGLALCRERGVDVVIVLGHPAYYARFGFSAALARSIEAPWAGEAFLALELRDGAMGGRHLKARYPAPFLSL